MRKTSIAGGFQRVMTIDPHDGIVVATNISRSQRGPEASFEPPPDPPRTRWLLRALAIFVPAAVALAMVSVLVGERARIDCDLQLQTAREAQPSTSLPVRAFFYAGLQSIEGPRLAVRQANAELVDSAQQVLLSMPMRPGLGDTLEVTLPLSSSWRGPLQVRVIARDQQSRVVVEQVSVVSDSAAALPAQPRPLRPLQQFAAGPVHRETQGLLPSALDAQIIGGACSPELPCEVLVHVGEPAAVIAVEPYAGLEVVTPPPPEPTADVVRFSVRMHGPEAELRIAASIDTRVVARRSFRLAVAQAMLPIETPSVLLAGSVAGSAASAAGSASSFTFARASGEAGCIVDVFHEERWVQTHSFERCDRVMLPGKPTPGLWRIQTRDDAFGGDAAAVRMIYVRTPSESPAQALTAIAGHVRKIQRDDLMARRVLERAESFAARDFEDYASWLLAALEDQLIALPPTASSYPLALNALDEKRARLRMFCLVALLLSAVAAVSLIARRGLHASARARDIMGDAGDPDAHSRARRARMTLTVIASAASIAVAFVAIALYVIARG